jgi:PEP-CTERM/exosortase A-associated glycosyltransferase
MPFIPQACRLPGPGPRNKAGLKKGKGGAHRVLTYGRAVDGALSGRVASERSMRILHVLDHGLPLQSGYTFRTRAILKSQIGRGWRVAAVTGPRHGAAEAEIETVDGLEFHRTGGARRGGVIGEVAGLAAFAQAIGRACDAFRPDIVHAHSPVLDALAAWPVARLRGLPLVYEIRAFWEDAAVGNGTGREGSLRYRTTRAIETLAARRADAVAVICEGLRGDLIARGIAAEKVIVSPNGVDLTLFGTPAPRDEALASELGLDGADVVGFIGSFYDYEGLDDLIAAMPALVARRPRARLVLVGGGPMEAALRAQAAASPVAEAIRFVGRVPHDMVERYYALIDVLAYPRKRMRLTDLVTPLKPLEAMAQGRLVAASDVGGHRELIRDGDTGTLFRPDDPRAIADALAAMFADRSGWDARRARARAFVAAERNWSSNITVYQPVYQGLMAAYTDETWSRSPRYRV